MMKTSAWEVCPVSATLRLEPGLLSVHFSLCFWIYTGKMLTQKNMEQTTTALSCRGLQEKKKKKGRNKGKQMAKDEGHIRLRSLSKCDDIGNL